MPFRLDALSLKNVFLVIVLMLFSATVFAVDKNKEIWNFENADIQTVVKRVSDATGKNFILDPRVQGQVTIISQHPLTKDEIYQVFLSVLRVHGFQAIETDDVVKIIPQDSANNDSGSVVSKVGKSSDQQIVKVIPLKFISPTEMVTSIREMIPRTSHIVALNSTNDLLIADTQSNVLKVEKIIQQVDTPQSQMVDIIAVKHASAPELVTTLTTLLREKGAAKASPVSLGADERTNNILITGGTKELRNYIHRVVEKLDLPSDSNSDAQVIYLKYVQASDIAPIVAAYLEEAIHTNKEEKVRAEGKESQASTAIATATSTNPNQGSGFANHLKALKENSANGGQQGSLFVDNENKPQSGIINRFVQWEETTNSIIVKAPPTIMRSIRSIIAKLDIRRPQVIIEVIIAEVTLDRLEEYGVEWDVSPNASIKAATRFPTFDTNTDGTSSGIVGGFAGGVVQELGEGLTVGVFRHGNLRALLRMLATDSQSNVLSTPTLVTLDNQTALIKVGQKVPFAIGQTNNQNVGGNPFTSYDREEVGLSLTIKPQIINNHEVKLQIENILSNIIPNSANASTGGNPTTSERTILTNVLVNEGKILVLGGLIQDQWNENRAQVPFIARIPWIGNLFKSQSKELVKTNLMIFLRPKIIHDDFRGVNISTQKYEETRQAQLETYDNFEHYFVDEPVTPPPLSEDDFYPNTKGRGQGPSDVILPSPFE